MCRYQSPIKKGAENPEIDIGSNHAPDHVIGEQIAVLRNTIFDLKTAHRGMDPSDVDGKLAATKIHEIHT